MGLKNKNGMASNNRIRGKLQSPKSGKNVSTDVKREQYDKMKEKIFSAVTVEKEPNEKNEESKVDECATNEDDECKASQVGVIAEDEIFKEREGQTDEQK